MRPVIDFHCDLLSYLMRDPARTANDAEVLGCAIPHLKEGSVKVQVCAIYADVVPESAEQGQQQASIFAELPSQYAGDFYHATGLSDWSQAAKQEGVAVIAALEGATTIANEKQSLASAIQNLDRILDKVGRLAYISLTHHKRNRFGGGNYEPGPVTQEGKVLLDAMVERGIPLCLSHSSDALAHTALEYLDQQGYHLPILASHSNYRSILEEPRNLPDDLVRVLDQRQGVIGLNMLRKFMHPTDPEGVFEHVAHAHALGTQHRVVMGADYFYTGDMPAEARAIREPFYLEPHADARFYPGFLDALAQRHSEAFARGVAWDHGLDWLERSVPLDV